MWERWLPGIFSTVIGLYLLVRNRSEAHGSAEWARLNNWRVLFGGQPEPASPRLELLIRILTIAAGTMAFVSGLLSLAGVIRFQKW